MLKEMSLASLGETKAGKQFEEVMRTIIESFEKDGDVDGVRTLKLDISFAMSKETGYISAMISVTAKTPTRKVGTIAAIEEGILKIDVMTNDVRQPGLPLQEAGKVTPIKGG